MEQTVNTFGKGLQMDTNPMVQGNETLSNALNATFVTMNGNEVILQNDMGNRRVDNAYLPSGYEPVGIKEHGGIIYLALYNPITNRSQIGSFPSPERNIGGEDIKNPENNKDLTATLLLDEAITEKLSFEENGIHYLNGDTLLTLLSNDTSLHAGDKFTIYCSENNIIWNPDVSKQISNFNQDTDRDKRRKFTLSLGVLNSQNEFVDITHTLKRFDENGKMLNDDDFESEEERFNTGYFIGKSAPSTTQIDRDKVAANTYAYKLVGPLYIKNEISHFSDFSYTLEAGKNGNEITLIFTGTATCNYLFDYNNNHVFDVRIKDKNGNIISYSSDPSFVITKGKNSYTQIAKYTFEASGEITYYIDVFGTKVDNTIYYLKDLSDYGTLNTEYINSNVCKFTGWRYSVDPINKICHISYSFEAYPSSTTTFDNLEIKIDNVKIEGLNPIIYTGRRDFIYEYSQDRKVLDVQISYNNNGTPVTINRFILTTELFNLCYSPSSEDYVPDYGLFMKNESSYKEDDYTDEFKEKLHIIKDRYLTVTPVIDGEIDPKSTPIEVPDDFKYFVKEPVDNKIICTTTNKYNIYVDTSNLTMGIQNENLYPNELKLSSITIDQKTLDIDTFNNTIKDSLLDDSILEYRPSSFKTNLEVSTLIAKASKDSSESNITLTYYDKFIAQAVTENRTISKLFVNLNSDLAIEKYIKGLKNSNSGWSMNYYMGGKLHHWWRLWINSNNVSSFDAGFSRNMQCNENDWGDREFSLTSDQSEWFDEDGNFNSAHLEMCTACSGNSIPFICGTNLPNLENIHFVDSTNPRTSVNSGKSAKYYCKVWQVNVSGTLTILENNNSDHPGLFEISNLEEEIATFLGKDYFGNPYVVPVENITLTAGDIYYPSNENYIYNNKYSFNFPVTVTATKNNLSLIGQNEKIEFKLPDTSISTTKSKELSFSSDNNFVGKVQGILQGDIFNKPIYIETGEVVENISNKIQKYVSGKLEIASQAPFEIQDGKLKCTKTVAESQTHRNSVMAMVTSDGDKWITALQFGKVPVLKKEHML